MPPRRPSLYSVVCLTAALLVLSSCRSLAHEVPAQLTVQGFIKPSGRTLQFVVRVPLSGLMATGMPQQGIGYLDLAHIDRSLNETALLVAKALELFENGRLLDRPSVVATRISLPYDASFQSYGQALALVTGPRLPVDTQVFWLQGYFDAVLEYPIASDRSDFAIHAGVTPLAPEVTTALAFMPPDGSVRSFQLYNDGGLVWLDPHWYQAAPAFLGLGWRYMLSLGDQWLFLFCLLLPVRRWRAVATLVAAFAAGHVLAILVFTFGPVVSANAWLPAVIDTLVAAGILYLALENIAASRFERRPAVVLIFGLVTGLGSAIALRQLLQFGGRHPLVSVLAFGAAASAAQIAALAILAVPLLVLYRYFTAERMRTIILSAMAANLAWSAAVTRVELLPTLDWPLLNAATLATAMSWLLGAVVTGGVLWLASGLLPGRAAAATTTPPEGPRPALTGGSGPATGAPVA